MPDALQAAVFHLSSGKESSGTRKAARIRKQTSPHATATRACRDVHHRSANLTKPIRSRYMNATALARVERWDPVRELEAVTDRVNRIFNRFPVRSETNREALTVADWMPSVDIAEDDKEYRSRRKSRRSTRRT